MLLEPPQPLHGGLPPQPAQTEALNQLLPGILDRDQDKEGMAAIELPTLPDDRHRHLQHLEGPLKMILIQGLLGRVKLSAQGRHGGGRALPQQGQEVADPRQTRNMDVALALTLLQQGHSLLKAGNGGRVIPAHEGRDAVGHGAEDGARRGHRFSRLEGPPHQPPLAQAVGEHRAWIGHNAKKGLEAGIELPRVPQQEIALIQNGVQGHELDLGQGLSEPVTIDTRQIHRELRAGLDIIRLIHAQQPKHLAGIIPQHGEADIAHKAALGLIIDDAIGPQPIGHQPASRIDDRLQQPLLPGLLRQRLDQLRMTTQARPIIKPQPRPQQTIAQGRVDAGIEDPAILALPAQLLHQRLEGGQVDALPIDRRQEHQPPQLGWEFLVGRKERGHEQIPEARGTAGG